METRRILNNHRGYLDVAYLRLQDGQTINKSFDEADGLNTPYVVIYDQKQPVAASRLRIEDGIGAIEKITSLEGYDEKKTLIKASTSWLNDLGIREYKILN